MWAVSHKYTTKLLQAFLYEFKVALVEGLSINYHLPGHVDSYQSFTEAIQNIFISIRNILVGVGIVK